MSPRTRCAAIGIAALCAVAWTAGARSQSVVGCFVNGRQVADSMCQPGGGAAAPANPSAAVMNSMGAALGAGMGAMMRNLMNDKPDPGAAQQAAERDAQQRAALQRAMDLKSEEERQRQQEQEEKSRAFTASQRELAAQMRSLDAESAGGQLQIREELRDSLNDPSSAPRGKSNPKPKVTPKPQQSSAAQAVPKGCILAITYQDGGQFYECIPDRGEHWDKYCLEIHGPRREQVPCNTSSQ